MADGLRRLRGTLVRALDHQRLRASHAEALPQLAVLGIACGLLAALAMIAFRMLIETVQAAFLPPGGPENYEALRPELRFALPILGGLALALVFAVLPERMRQVGVIHVMERLAYHDGKLPLRNAVVQFFAAATAIITGMPVGREGPAIHIGAAVGSASGERLGLPNNSLRILAGCGVAAAIAASFNTPLAGVAFAIEVVLMEYTVVGFAPVILAAVSATALTHLAYGNDASFAVPQMTLVSLAELPFVLAMGLAIGVLAAAFNRLVRTTASRTHRWPFALRMLLAGVIAGACALPAPQIMGIGYDTIAATLLGAVPATTLVAIVVFKLLSTGAAIGLGVPAGLIGPILLIGAAAGGASGTLGALLGPGDGVSAAGFYALIGLGAMMAGTLHAPLAALTAMLELTGNPHIIWPGMLAVIAAYGMSRVVFGQQPIFIALLRARGLDYRNDPITQSLRRVSVGAVMDLSVVPLPRLASREAIEAALVDTPRWIIATGPEGPEALLRGMDLARESLDPQGPATLDLLELPAARLQVGPIALEATLQEALDRMDASGTDALYVARRSAGPPLTYGVVTRDAIESAYVYRRAPGAAAMR